MPRDSNDERKAVSFEELAYSNMMLVQALVDVLAEKGILTQEELIERVQRLKEETKTHGPSA